MFETSVNDTGLSSTMSGPVIFAVTLTIFSHPSVSVTLAVIVTVLFSAGISFIT